MGFEYRREYQVIYRCKYKSALTLLSLDFTGFIGYARDSVNAIKSSEIYSDFRQCEFFNYTRFYEVSAIRMLLSCAPHLYLYNYITLLGWCHL